MPSKCHRVDVCNEFTSKPAPEYAYFDKNKKYTFHYMMKDGKARCEPENPEVIDAPYVRLRISDHISNELKV